MDCDDPAAMAGSYGRLLGWEITYRGGDNFILMRDPAGGTGVSFQQVPGYQPPVYREEPGHQTKMVHLDTRVTDLAAATVHALACGARLASHQGRDDLRVLLDPAGHPFCRFTI